MTEKVRKDVSKRILATRHRLRLSQSAVSRRAGMHPSYLSRIEKGKVHPTVQTAMRLAAALRVSLNDLLGPSPTTQTDQPCPVSASGHCLMDLFDAGADSGGGRDGEIYSSQQLRLMRKFMALLRHGSPSLLTALEALVSEILKERQRIPTPNTNQPKNGN
ncbi:MAG: helix-turn-helix transcriptional regulator [Candidatus Binatia bacterium]|nr:helix-turn-helix transcriptional regulator [Candidatus Binatia bacterium]